MKRPVILMSVLLLSFFVQAQNIKLYDVIPYRKDTLWGFADLARNIIISPQFDEMRFFKEDITAVRMGDKWAFINKRDRLLTPFKYDLAGDFKEGMCQVRVGDKVGYVNNRGKEAVKPAYQFCNEFSEGVAVVSDSIDGKLISKVIDKSGRIILSGLVVASGQFHSGYLAVEENGSYFFIDKKGTKLTLPAGTELYYEFSEDVAIVKLRATHKVSDTAKEIVYYLGMINSAGQLTRDTISDIFGYKFSVSSAQKVIANFVNGFAILQRQNTMQDYAAYKDKKEYAFLSRSGKMSLWYSTVRAFNSDGRSLVVATNDSIPKIIDNQFKTIPFAVTMVDAGTFSEGMLRVKFSDSGKWGYVDEKGQIVIYPLFDECTDFSGGVAVVTINGKKGCINKSGVQFWEN